METPGVADQLSVRQYVTTNHNGEARYVTNTPTVLSDASKGSPGPENHDDAHADVDAEQSARTDRIHH